MIQNELVIAGGIGKPSDIVEWLEIDSVVAIMIGSALIYSKYTISDFHNEGLRKGIKLREI